MSPYVLPDLSYDYGALEPRVSGRVLELHHAKHHASYVTGANEALERLEDARLGGDPRELASTERQLAFNLAGHLLHSLFWRNLTPNGSAPPEGDLAHAIDRDLGGLARLKTHMVTAAMGTMGSGWAALVYEPIARRLLTIQLHDHQSNLVPGTVPLLVIDAWEHAYYLQYGPEKSSFFGAVWDLIDWDDVERRFDLARVADLDLRGAALSDGRSPDLHVH